MEYPKTENLWKRNEETHIMSPFEGFRMEEVGMIDKWLVLEKIDGMNMRVIWDPYDGVVRFAGRTDRALIPGDLTAKMEAYFTPWKLAQVIEPEGALLPERVILFGEGYGAGIQQGGHYREDKDFMLFDVAFLDAIGRIQWLRWSRVTEIAERLGIDTVPVLGEGLNLTYISVLVEYMAEHGGDGTITDKPEGIIARTDPYIYDGRGRRIMFKHKVRDVLKYLEHMDELAHSA